MMEAVSHAPSAGGQRPPEDFFVDLRESLLEDEESFVDFDEEVSRKLWHDVAGLRKEVRVTPAHVVVEKPPALTKTFFQHTFGTWIETLVGQDLREHVDNLLDRKGYPISEYQDDILRTLNDVGRIPVHGGSDEQWGAASSHERLSSAVHAFRALISNQPTWISHIDFLLVGSGQTWQTFLETDNGRLFLEQVNACMACTNFPVHTVRDQLATRKVLMNNGVLYPQAQAARGELGWTDSARNAARPERMINEYALAHDEGARIREEHEQMFAEAAQRVRVLESSAEPIEAVEATLGDLANIGHWRTMLQSVSDRMLKIDQRRTHIAADHEKHQTEKDRSESRVSAITLQGEFQSLSLRMHALRQVGEIIQRLTAEGLTIDPEWSLHELRTAVQHLAEKMIRQPFTSPEGVTYAN